VAVWLQKLVLNFPMALCWQIFFAGPAVRNVFRIGVGMMYRNDDQEEEMDTAA